MTFPVERELSCPICKTTSTFEIILSTNQFGSCDLDTRPPEMMRSTINSWVQACPSCNYVATQFTDPPTVDAEFLKAENYLNCDGIPFKSELAKNFYRLYLIKKHDNEPEQAFTEALHAAWALTTPATKNAPSKPAKLQSRRSIFGTKTMRKKKLIR